MHPKEVIAYLDDLTTKNWILFNEDNFVCGVEKQIKVYYHRINSISKVKGGVLILCPGVSIVIYHRGKTPTVKIYDTGV